MAEKSNKAKIRFLSVTNLNCVLREQDVTYKLEIGKFRNQQILCPLSGKNNNNNNRKLKKQREHTF